MACTVSLIQLLFAESPGHICQTVYFIQRAHLHKRANGHCKNRQVVLRIWTLSWFQHAWMTAIEIYIASTTETNSMNSSIMTSLQIYITSITECDAHSIHIKLGNILNSTKCFYVLNFSIYILVIDKFFWISKWMPCLSCIMQYKELICKYINKLYIKFILFKISFHMYMWEK